MNVCRRCGCTASWSRPGGCTFVAPGLCTVCGNRMRRDARLARLVDRLPAWARNLLGNLVGIALWRAAGREQRAAAGEDRDDG